MKHKDSLQGSIIRFIRNITSKQHNLQSLTYYNEGFQIDAENFNLIEIEINDLNKIQKRPAFYVVIKSIAAFIYRFYLMGFFCAYLIVWALGFILK